MSISSKTPLFLPCQACQLNPARHLDMFCVSCRRIIQERSRGFFHLGTLARSGTIIIIEVMLAIFTSLLMSAAPLVTASSSASPQSAVLFPLLFGAFVSPLLASLSAWRIRPYITRSGRWGWIRVAPILVFTLLMVLAFPVGGLRLSSVQPAILWIGVAALTWILGVGSSTLQERCIQRFRQPEWRDWTLKGWALACGVQCLIGFVSHDRTLGLFLGILASQSIYHIVAQLMITRFAREADLAKELQKEYRLVWYNR